jgi:hypothetical protein
VLGVGLGNYDVVALDQQAFLFQGHLVDASTQGWNTFAYILGTTGVPGLLLFLGMLRSALSRERPLAILFGLGMFADGTLLGAAFWVFFALYARDEPA